MHGAYVTNQNFEHESNSFEGNIRGSEATRSLYDKTRTKALQNTNSRNLGLNGSKTSGAKPIGGSFIAPSSS